MRSASAILFLALGLGVAVLVVAFELDPRGSRPPTWLGVRWDARFVETLLLIIATLSGAGLAASLAFGRGAPRRSAVIALGLAAATAGTLYLYGRRGVAGRHYVKWHDSFHYVLGAKYFDEVGYLGFYDCAARAHIENNPWAARRGFRVRDLESYAMIDAALAAARCRDRFSPARWKEFRADVALFGRGKSIPSLLTDHGYNGAPFHTFLASRVANAADLDYRSVTFLALIDVAAISLMLAVVAYAFGAPVGLIFAILFFVNFSDRFYFIGGSMMRYVWMASLAGGIAMLRLGRYRTAGALMTIAGLLNVFPVLFIAGLLVRAVWSLLRDRVVDGRHRRFIAAAALTGAIGVGLGAAGGDGPGNYTEFFGFIGGHSRLLTSSRTGLQYTVLYRGQNRRSDPPVSYRRKARELRAATPLIVVVGAAMVLAALLLCRRLDDVEACALLGFVLFFVIFGTVEYYYAVTPILVLAFYRRTPWLAVGLLAMMALVLEIWRRTQFLKLCNNTVMSAALLSFLAAALVYLHAEGRLRAWRLGVAVAAAALSGPAMVAAGYLIWG